METRRRQLCRHLIVVAVVLVGCAGPGAQSNRPHNLGSARHSAPSHKLASVQLEAPSPDIVSASFDATSESGDAPEVIPPPVVADPLPGDEAIESDLSYPIDLPTALRLADAENLQVALAREQIRQAFARVDAAKVLWLPSIRAGLNYNRHEGAIQDVVGHQFNTSRGALYSGLGAGGFGAGSPTVPGVYANFHLADAIFQPLAARQFAGSRRRAAAATLHNTLASVAQGYIDLLRAQQEVAIASEALDNVQKLADLTTAYASSGEGLQADADRMQAELAIRKNDVARAEEAVQVANVRLAQLLRIDSTLVFAPLEPRMAPIEMIDADIPVQELIAQGLSNRPELSEGRLLVAEAVQRLRRERFAPLIPSVLVGTSYGGLGAGVGGNLAGMRGRLDVDAVAFWEMRNLGLGDRAAQRNARSQVRQVELRQLAALDAVAREVSEAYAQAQARQRQIATAEEGIEAAQHSYERNLERIQAAKGLPIEALQAIQALAQAHREYLRAVSDYNQSQFALFRALGWPERFPLGPTDGASP